MSHKITIRTEITDEAAVRRACKERRWGCEVANSIVSFRTGPLARATLDLRTGAIVGDTDLHSQDAAEEFAAVYSEALWMNRIEEGGYLESREVLTDGTIRLTATVAVA